MVFLQLFIAFFAIGLFGFGGEYAMVSLLQNILVNRFHWLSVGEFTNVIAVSQMTPGPISLNTATYCGYTAIQQAGYSDLLAVVGSITATLALVLPSFLLMLFVCKIFIKYMNTTTVQSILLGLRPMIVGLLLASTLLLMTPENFSTPANPWAFWISIGLFIATFVGVKVVGINPLRMIGYSAFAGLLLLY
jgi:chromate transport protein